ncbi:MAG: hypothetical protein AAGI52_08310 [Bacteroidota bacterium]
MRYLFLLALCFVLLASDTHAQLSGLVNRARRAAQTATQDRTPETPAPQAATQRAPAVAPADEPLAPSGAMPTSPQGYAPGVDMWDWLKQLAFLSPGAASQGGALQPRTFSETGVVFPAPDARYQVVVRDAAGSVLTFQDLNLEVDRTFPAFGMLKLRNSPENRARPLFAMTPGTYRFAITAEGHEIGAATLDVAVQGTDDPFDTRTTTQVSGPWKDLGVLAYDDESDGLEFTFWISSDLASRDGARLRVHLYRGRERLTDDRASLALWKERPSWTAHTKGLYKERGQLTLSDLSDGDYRIEVAEEDAAPVRTYPFTVQGGAIVPHGRSALDHARPDFLTPSRGRGDRDRGIAGVERLVWIEAE